MATHNRDRDERLQSATAGAPSIHPGTESCGGPFSLPPDNMTYSSSSLHNDGTHALSFALYKQILVRNGLRPGNVKNRKYKYKI